MYDESYELFHKTMAALNENIDFLEQNGINTEKYAVVVIVDGIEQFVKGIQSGEQKVFNKFFDLDEIYKFHEIKKKKLKNIMEIKIKDEEIIDEERHLESIGASVFNPNRTQGNEYEFAHIFSTTTRISDRNAKPLNVYFCVKQSNKGKLDSHLWFFGGFCHVVQPFYCMLIDVGTEPHKDSMFYMLKAFEKDENIAGVCGEIIPKSDCSSFNVLYHAQIVEYKFSHILDKALETLIGYISVLPGAFSAYRWDALKGTEKHSPL